MRILWRLLLVAVLLLTMRSSAHAATIDSTNLIEHATVMDNKTITYKGEALIAIMPRGDHAWVNVNDGYNAIGVWCKRELLCDVKWFGDYKHEGDVIQVTGVFHRACPMHGGELDIHADSIKIETTGFAFEEKVSEPRVTAAMAFFILTLVAIFILRKRL